MPTDSNNTGGRSLGRVFVEGGVFALGWIAASKLWGLAEKSFDGGDDNDAIEGDDEDNAPFTDE